MSARHYRPASLRRRLPACLRALRVDDLPQARRLLRRDPQLIAVALDALLLGVTEFFRDGPVFDYLAAALPKLRATRGDAVAPPARTPEAGTTPGLRVWSAGCSDGAELYSVAMLLSDAGMLDESELVGTDCRDEAIARATAGVNAPAALRGLSPANLARHFEPDGRQGAWRVAAALRERVTWRRRDVLAGPAPGPWDVVLCRNLSMYLQPAAAERLWRGVVNELRPGGLLVLGKAERPCGPAALELCPVGPCTYRRYGAP